MGIVQGGARQGTRFRCHSFTVGFQISVNQGGTDTPVCRCHSFTVGFQVVEKQVN